MGEISEVPLDNCGCTPELVKKHEEMLTKTQISLGDFLERYDRDRLECAQRYRDEHMQTNVWHENFDRKLNDIEKVLAEMWPNYKFGMYFFGVIILGSLSLIFKTVWDHIVLVAPIK